MTLTDESAMTRAAMPGNLVTLPAAAAYAPPIYVVRGEPMVLDQDFGAPFRHQDVPRVGGFLAVLVDLGRVVRFPRQIPPAIRLL